MKLVRKGHGHTHRGVIGVESAIVMIAFVIVAAALAFVVLNMGFSTTQRAKTAIIASLEEASSSLEIAGKVTGSGDVTASLMNVTAVPLKIASGGDSVNMNLQLTAVKYLSNSIEYDNIYNGTLQTGNYVNLTQAMQVAVSQSLLRSNPVNDTANPGQTTSILYWAVNRNNNFIIDQGEHAIMAIVHGADERPGPLDTIRAEIIVPTGAPLTIERLVPNVTHDVVDLG
ncbi:flagellin [Nitrosopumilus sp. b1]|uniref:archaellin/type IV pilin N-terminal domain-containing protein n=1 Tax=Nitrosopumilus sp. b1 TaxID=2109907 RepID=UPI0015F4A474|nr:archaellin/type IV pilin N-terminal domain-containing protein [Nitrosopumilus sp. b1]KAF6243102.1 flagellin [Nitrosopumilus sp. b1]